MDQNGNKRKNSFLTRRKLLAVAFSLALAALLFTNASMALLKMNTGSVENTFTKGSVGAEIKETVSNNAKTDIRVKNTGDSPVYVRVRLVSYWLNEDGTVAAKASPAISFSPDDSWTKDGAYYYHKTPVGGGSQTDNLIASGSSIQMKTEDGCKQVIEVLAEVVQATPQDAVKQLWGESAAAALGLGN